MRSFLILPLLAFSFETLCQGQISVIDNTINPGLVIDEFKSKPETNAPQTYYYNEVWLPSIIKLKNRVTLKDFLTKYDLYNNQIELKVEDIVKVCPSHLIDRVVLINPAEKDSSVFVDAKGFKFYDGTPTAGLMKVYERGQYSLGVQYLIEKQQSNYVEALDMGSKNEKLVESENYFIIKDQKVLCELKNSTKNLECSEIPEKILSDVKMKTKTVSDKLKFIDYLNKSNPD